jgi:predicted RNA-binding protein
MCEAVVYVVRDGDKQKIMEGDKLLLTDLFGEQKLITARVKTIDLIGHEIILG